MPNTYNNGEARAAILGSIRSHLQASIPHDARETATHEGEHADSRVQVAAPQENNGSLVQMFKESLEAVDGHCVVVNSELEIVRELSRIIAELRASWLPAKRIALSDAPAVERLARLIAIEVDELVVMPTAAELFGFDVGITTAQAAIAETGTLVLNAADERHRLVSLVPPVHIAIVEAANIQQTLGETLSRLHKSGADVSSTITFVTGPSRTADIELTLAIGVHGPQELHVIVKS